jgi:hypothetical protein
MQEKSQETHGTVGPFLFRKGRLALDFGIPLLPENGSPGLSAKSHLQITWAEFWGQEIRLIICQTKKMGEVNLSKHCCPTSERQWLPYKGSSRAQRGWMTGCTFPMAAGLHSPGIWCHFSEVERLGWQVYCSGSQREIRGGERAAWPNWRAKGVTLH